MTAFGLLLILLAVVPVVGLLTNQRTQQTGSAATAATEIPDQQDTANGAPGLGLEDQFILNSPLFNRSKDDLSISSDMMTEPDPTQDSTLNPETETTPAETAPEPTPAAPQFAAVNYTLYVSANKLNLRAEPTVDAAVLAQLKFGDKVLCEGENSEWMKVRFNDVTGYLKTEYTSRAMVFKSVSETVFVKSSSLNLRAEPSTEAQIIAKLGKNTILTRIGIGDQWSKVVTSSGAKGYVSSEYLSTLPVVAESIRYSKADFSNISQSEIDLLTRIVALEASSRYGYSGYLAVASAILNRVESSRFPSTISGVVGQINQFSTFSSIRTPTDNTNLRKAIADALAGKRNLPAYVMYFITYGAYKGNVEEGGTFSRLVPYTVAYGTVWCYKASDLR